MHILQKLFTFTDILTSFGHGWPESPQEQDEIKLLHLCHFLDPARCELLKPINDCGEAGKMPLHIMLREDGLHADLLRLLTFPIIYLTLTLRRHISFKPKKLYCYSYDDENCGKGVGFYSDCSYTIYLLLKMTAFILSQEGNEEGISAWLCHPSLRRLRRSVGARCLRGLWLGRHVNKL